MYYALNSVAEAVALIGSASFGAATCAFIFVRRERLRGARTAKGPVTPLATCRGCAHAFSYHAKDSGPCAFHETRTVSQEEFVEHNGKLVNSPSGKYARRIVTHLVNCNECPCQQYDGPTPYPEMI